MLKTLLYSLSDPWHSDHLVIISRFENINRDGHELQKNIFIIYGWTMNQKNQVKNQKNQVKNQNHESKKSGWTMNKKKISSFMALQSLLKVTIVPLNWIYRNLQQSAVFAAFTENRKQGVTLLFCSIHKPPQTALKVCGSSWSFLH